MHIPQEPYQGLDGGIAAISGAAELQLLGALPTVWYRAPQYNQSACGVLAAKLLCCTP